MSRIEKAYRKGVKVSDRHGAAEWGAERLSALALIPLCLWGLWGAWTIAGSGYDGARAWLAQPINAVLLTITLLIGLWHASMGLKVIVDDYVHKPSSRTALLAFIALLCLAVAGLSVFFIGRLALGSAPLPAGLGA